MPRGLTGSVLQQQDSEDEALALLQQGNGVLSQGTPEALLTLLQQHMEADPGGCRKTEDAEGCQQEGIPLQTSQNAFKMDPSLSAPLLTSPLWLLSKRES